MTKMIACLLFRRVPGWTIANPVFSSRFAEPEPVCAPPLLCLLPLPLSALTSLSLCLHSANSSPLMWYTSKQKGGAPPSSSRYESKPPPPLPLQQQQPPQQQYRPQQQQHSPHHPHSHQNTDPRRLSPSPYGGHGNVMSPPPQAQGPRPTTHNRPPAQQRLPPSPAPAEGADPTLLPLFRAVDKNGEIKHLVFQPTCPRLFCRPSGRRWRMQLGTATFGAVSREQTPALSTYYYSFLTIPSSS
jgi:hypothetical protein